MVIPLLSWLYLGLHMVLWAAEIRPEETVIASFTEAAGGDPLDDLGDGE